MAFGDRRLVAAIAPNLLALGIVLERQDYSDRLRALTAAKKRLEAKEQLQQQPTFLRFCRNQDLIFFIEFGDGHEAVQQCSRLRQRPPLD